MTVPMLMPNAPAACVSLELGARAGAHAVVSACASSTESIGYGVEASAAGRADVVIAGGTEASIHPMHDRRVRRDAGALAAQRRPRAAPRAPTTSTATASSWARAPASSSSRARSTPPPAAPAIYAASPAAAVTPTRTTSPSPEPRARAQIRAMRAALEESGIARIDVVAHQRARDVDRRSATSSSTRRSAACSATGRRHPASRPRRRRPATCSAAPVRWRRSSRSSRCATAWRRRRSTSTTQTRDPARLVARQAPRARRRRMLAISNSFGFGGHNVALVVASV